MLPDGGTADCTLAHRQHTHSAPQLWDVCGMQQRCTRQAAGVGEMLKDVEEMLMKMLEEEEDNDGGGDEKKRKV